MSAVPKKKLCWNCEGNIAKDTDNCPYCGVYLHGSEEETFWGPTYQPNDNESDLEIPSPLYASTSNEHSSATNKPAEEIQESNQNSLTFSTELSKDFFPMLFLMAGSLFFLFGLVLLLFSQDGTFTLQWNEDYWIFFWILSLPLLYAGWHLLQKLDSAE
jgi:hypothetical protein